MTNHKHEHYMLGIVLAVAVVAAFSLGSFWAKPIGEYEKYAQPYNSPKMLDTSKYVSKGGLPNTGYAYHGELDAGYGSNLNNKPIAPIPAPLYPVQPSPRPSYPIVGGQEKIDEIVHTKECSSRFDLCVFQKDWVIFFDGENYDVLEYKYYDVEDRRIVFEDQFNGMARVALVQNNFAQLKINGKVFSIYVESTNMYNPRISADLNADHLINGYRLPLAYI